MAKKVEIVLNRAGVRELLRSKEIGDACMQAAVAYQSRLPAVGYGVTGGVYTGQNRVNVSVGALTEEAVKDNLANNTLLKSL